MEPYRHEDADGDVLTISERGGKPGTALVKARGGAEVNAADLPEIIRALHEACGLPPAVILERPDFAGLARDSAEWSPDADSLLRAPPDRRAVGRADGEQRL